MAVTADDLVDAAVGAARPGLFLDFDGTIAAIVPTPSEARPLPGIRPLLASLTSKMTTVAIISSRPVSFLRSVLGDVRPQPVLIGLSGVERYEAGRVQVVDEAEGWTATVREALLMAPDLLPDGADIEDKGMSFTVHYRGHPELGPRVEQVCASLARTDGSPSPPGSIRRRAVHAHRRRQRNHRPPDGQIARLGPVRRGRFRGPGRLHRSSRAGGGRPGRADLRRGRPVGRIAPHPRHQRRYHRGRSGRPAGASSAASTARWPDPPSDRCRSDRTGSDRTGARKGTASPRRQPDVRTGRWRPIVPPTSEPTAGPAIRERNHK